MATVELRGIAPAALAHDARGFYVACAGDSIMSGNGAIGGSASCFEQFCFFADGKVRRIAAGANGLNGGRAGVVSKTIADNLWLDVIQYKPALCIVHVGGNDRGGSTQTIQPGSGTVGNGVYYARQITSELRAHGILVALLTIPNKPDGSVLANETWYNNTIKADVAALRAAGDNGVIVVDAAATIANQATGLPLNNAYYYNAGTADVHPSDYGSTQIASAILSAVIAEGWLPDGFAAHKPSSSVDANNAIVNGTFEGTPVSGVAPSWQIANPDTKLTASVLTGVSGRRGNVQKLVANPGIGTGTNYMIPTTAPSLVSRRNKRVAFSMHIKAVGFQAAGASWNISVAARTTANASVAFPCSFSQPIRVDGEGTIYGEMELPRNSDNLLVQPLFYQNPGGSDVELHISEVALVDLTPPDQIMSSGPNIILATTAQSPAAADSGKTYTNEGATAIVVCTLPTAVKGYEYSFIVQDADGVRVVAAAGDTIRDGASVSAAAGKIESTTVGDAVTLRSINNTEWIVTAKNGAGWATT